MLELVLGTHNAKKLAEMRELVAHLPLRVSSLTTCPNAIEVEETGQTFVENARLKAQQQAVHLGRWVLAEDSGLSVPALDGAPGVYSARYAGEPSDDAANNEKLLAELAELPGERRAAYYTCQLCLADPQGRVRFEASGQCHGRITDQPRGSHGFGYDPLFLIPEYHRTFAELGPQTKRAISHRARAMAEFARAVPNLLRDVAAENQST
jgi:XTP/dITP diphosphohydrolase